MKNALQLFAKIKLYDEQKNQNYKLTHAHTKLNPITSIKIENMSIVFIFMLFVFYVYAKNVFHTEQHSINVSCSLDTMRQTIVVFTCQYRRRVHAK